MPIKVKLLEATGNHGEDAREYALKYWVSLDSKNKGPLAAILATGWSRGDHYELSADEIDVGSICIGIDANPTDPANFIDYEVEVRFGKPQINPGSDPENPLADPVDEQWSYSSAEIPLAVDLLGHPLVNTAGDIFEENFRGNIPQFTFTRNEANLNRTLWVNCRNAVNNDIWKGFAAKTVKVSNITAQSQYASDGTKYYKVQYQFDTNPATWRFRPLNAGSTQIAPDATGMLRRQNCMVGGYDDPVVCPLDADGKSLRALDGSLTGTPFLLDFQIYPEMDFGALFPFL